MKLAKCVCGGNLFTRTGENVTRCDACCLVLANGSHEDCEHDYAVKDCPKCGSEFCYDCCAYTNVDQGGKHEPDSMICPFCGHDYYS